jgi:hypothetical protein
MNRGSPPSVSRDPLVPIAPTEFQDEGQYLRGLLWACVPLVPFWYGIYRATELLR